MKPIFAVTYTIKDRGATWPPKTVELSGPGSGSLNKYLRKNSHSMGLSKKFEATIEDAQLVGYGDCDD